jgi:hypothetical protein
MGRDAIGQAVSRRELERQARLRHRSGVEHAISA